MTWLRPDEAVALLEFETGQRFTLNHVRVLAHRRGWHKAGRGREIGYWLDDVVEEVTRRMRGGHKALDRRVM